MLVDGAWIVEPGRAKEEIHSFFKNRFEEIDWVRPKLNGVRFQAIGHHKNVRLIERFGEKVLKEVVWECASDKTPGLDGINSNLLENFGR